MDEKLYTGIVLRSYLPQKHKIIILDNELGKIQVVCTLRKYHPLVHGSLLWYTRKAWHNMYQISHYELIALPAQWVISDIYFMHHILELGLFFLPFHKNMEELYKLFLRLYESCDQENKILYKKVFMYRFFCIISIYPEDITSYNSYLLSLISNLDDIMLNVQYDVELQIQLTQWIEECIKIHPQKDQLKTGNFLKYMD